MKIPTGIYTLTAATLLGVTALSTAAIAQTANNVNSPSTTTHRDNADVNVIRGTENRPDPNTNSSFNSGVTSTNRNSGSYMDSASGVNTSTDTRSSYNTDAISGSYMDSGENRSSTNTSSGLTKRSIPNTGGTSNNVGSGKNYSATGNRGVSGSRTTGGTANGVGSGSSFSTGAGSNTGSGMNVGKGAAGTGGGTGAGTGGGAGG